MCLVGGPYATFAGRDASRGLAKQSFEADMLSPLDQPIDSLSDLTESEWKNLRDWESESLACSFHPSPVVADEEGSRGPGHFETKYTKCGCVADAFLLTIDRE